ncbi:hypothetical protein BDP27DRAFT_1399168 [Rhodocollybia butyracea]|uniref:Uncharacterized protein n=1 Tax=Rhodocollybia butyracea TaxID=206335 RepID=A0A9P5Q7Z9_9AGAR|nr:hypothetical protein BDP27DRAFT_1399168 [Rhodocollybia butyracea]
MLPLNSPRERRMEESDPRRPITIGSESGFQETSPEGKTVTTESLLSDRFSWENLHQLTEGLRPKMEQLIKDEIHIPFWEPQIDGISPEIQQFIHDLRLPRARGAGHTHLPEMVLHRLGCFQENEKLRKRLHILFSTNTHKIYMNTSGSGKTRTVLEHLCAHWGLYLTCHRDSRIGSLDIEYAIRNIESHKLFQSTLPYAPSLLVTPEDKTAYRLSHDYPEHAVIEDHEVLEERIKIFRDGWFQYGEFLQALRNNRRVVNFEISLVLLARLLVLQEFVKTLLYPEMLSDEDNCGDIFTQCRDNIASMFSGDLSISEKVEIIEKNLKGIVKELQATLETAPLGRLLDIVVDECQFAPKAIESAFRSTDLISNGPILRLSREIIFEPPWWPLLQSRHFVTMYTKQIHSMTQMSSSSISKCFSPQMPGTLRRFNVFAVEFAFGFEGDFISLVLQNGYQNMNKLLNEYIQSLAGFIPADYTPMDHESISPMIRYPPLAFDFENLNEEMRDLIQKISHEYLFTSKLATGIGRNESKYIQLGFARIRRESGGYVTTIDEPLVLLACSIWFNNKHSDSIYSTLAVVYSSMIRVDGMDMDWKKRRKLNDIFDFSKVGKDNNILGNKLATLVTLHLDDSGELVEGKVRLSSTEPSLFGPVGLRIGAGSKGHSVLKDWVSLKRHTAFCFPMNHMGPDIMCFLKLEDAKEEKAQGDEDDQFDSPSTYVCLAIQCKLYRARGSLVPPMKLREAIATITPQDFFKHRQSENLSKSSEKREDILNALHNLGKHLKKDPLAGEYGVIRIICGFPVEVDLSKAFVKGEKTDESEEPSTKKRQTDDLQGPLAKFSRDRLIRETKNSNKDILKVIERSATDAKIKKDSSLDENDPAVLGLRAEPVFQNLTMDHGRLIVERAMMEIEMCRGTERERKRKFSYLDLAT